MAIRRPPSPITSPQFTVLSPGTELHRVHRTAFRPAEFNPGAGGRTRFAPFSDSAGAPVPSLYAGATLRAAIHETILHDVPASAAIKTVRLNEVHVRTHSALRTNRGLRLVELRNVTLATPSGGRSREAGAGRGTAGKTAVVGVNDRATKRVKAKVVQKTDKATLHRFVTGATRPGAKVCTDDAKGYEGILYDHETVQHSVSEYVRGQAHTNGIESFWSMLRRGYQGTCHKMSPKHLERYVEEFAGRHNVRDQDTINQMGKLARGMAGKRVRYRELTADNGLDSGARTESLTQPGGLSTRCTNARRSADFELGTRCAGLYVVIYMMCVFTQQPLFFRISRAQAEASLVTSLPSLMTDRFLCAGSEGKDRRMYCQRIHV